MKRAVGKSRSLRNLVRGDRIKLTDLHRARFQLILVTSQTRETFVSLKRGPTAHRLHAIPFFVKELEIDGSPCGNFKRDASVFFHVDFAKNVFNVPTSVVERDRRLNKAAVDFAGVAAFSNL